MRKPGSASRGREASLRPDGRLLSALLAALSLIAIPLVHASPAAARPACGSPAGSTFKLADLPDKTGEVSGLVASERHRGVGWMIRDSGHPASLYAFRLRKGRPEVHEVKVTGAANEDWEDVSYSVGPDGRGRLWIVESTQSRSDPYIYEVVEPSDPFTVRAVPLARRYRYAYPDQRYENTEASFVWDGHLVLATKTKPARLYRFGRLSTKKVNRPELVGELRGANRISVTRLAPDRRSLVASNHEFITVFAGDGKLSDFTGRGPRRTKRIAEGDNIEAGDFFPSGSCDVLMLSERKNVYRVMAERS